MSESGTLADLLATSNALPRAASVCAKADAQKVQELPDSCKLRENVTYAASQPYSERALQEYQVKNFPCFN